MWGFLNNWWNLPFLVMLGLVGVFFLLQVVGFVGHADADHEHDLDADADHEHEVEAHHDFAGDVLAFFRVGRVPFMVIWVTLFIFTGFTGIFLNSLLWTRSGSYVGWWFVVVVLVSLVVGLAAVRLLSGVAARLVDVGGKGASRKHELAGRLGVVASPRLDDKHGEVRVRDERGDELIVHGCVRGEGALKQGDKVVLVDFDPRRELFWVTACPDADVDDKRG